MSPSPCYAASRWLPIAWLPRKLVQFKAMPNGMWSRPVVSRHLLPCLHEFLLPCPSSWSLCSSAFGYLWTELRILLPLLLLWTLSQKPFCFVLWNPTQKAVVCVLYIQSGWNLSGGDEVGSLPLEMPRDRNEGKCNTIFLHAEHHWTQCLDAGWTFLESLSQELPSVHVRATWTSDGGEGCTLIRRPQLAPCSSRS